MAEAGHWWLQFTKTILMENVLPEINGAVNKACPIKQVSTISDIKQ